MAEGAGSAGSARSDMPGSTEAADERVEWVDEEGTVVEVVTRSRMRRENLRHRSVAIVVLSSDGGRLLVHRRADDKDLRPGWWDVCAGGVVMAGESYPDAARRELAEELGVAGVELEPLGSGRFDADDSRELAQIYVTQHDGPFEFADGEVAEARFVDSDELTRLMAAEPFLPSGAGMVLPLVDGFG